MVIRTEVRLITYRRIREEELSTQDFCRMKFVDQFHFYDIFHASEYLCSYNPEEKL
jgi:hypothetical protein